MRLLKMSGRTNQSSVTSERSPSLFLLVYMNMEFCKAEIKEVLPEWASTFIYWISDLCIDHWSRFFLLLYNSLLPLSPSLSPKNQWTITKWADRFHQKKWADRNAHSTPVSLSASNLFILNTHSVPSLSSSVGRKYEKLLNSTGCV